MLFAPRAYTVVAAVHLEIARKCNTSIKEEQGVECIGCDHEEGRNGESFADCPRYEVEQRQHSEDGNKHDVIDDRWIAAVRIGDHVSYECHYEESPEELLEKNSVSASVIMQLQLWVGGHLKSTQGQIDY